MKNKFCVLGGVRTHPGAYRESDGLGGGHQHKRPFLNHIEKSMAIFKFKKIIKILNKI